MADQRVAARQLETMPAELISQILDELRFGDLIMLWQTGRPFLHRAITNSNAWAGLWPQDATERELLISLYGDVIRPNRAIIATIRHKLSDWSPRRKIMDRPWCDDLFWPWERGVPHEQNDVRFVHYLDAVAHSLAAAIPCSCLYDKLMSFYGGSHRHGWIEITNDLLGFYHGETDPMRIRRLKAIIHDYRQAQAGLNAARRDQILQLASLYDAYPTLLKGALAPQTARPNQEHIPQRLRVCAKRVMRVSDLQQVSSGKVKCKSLFFFQHAPVVPYDWCLTLWLKVLELCPALWYENFSSDLKKQQILGQSPFTSIPDSILGDMCIAQLGLLRCYSWRDADPDDPDDPRARFRQATLNERFTTPRINLADGNRKGTFYIDTTGERHDRCEHRHGPVDAREVEWLAAFCRAVAWMLDAFPGTAKKILDKHEAELKVRGEEEARQRKQRKRQKEWRKEIKRVKRADPSRRGQRWRNMR